MSYKEFLSHFIFNPDFPKYLMTRNSKIKRFRFSREISAPFAPEFRKLGICCRMESAQCLHCNILIFMSFKIAHGRVHYGGEIPKLQSKKTN